MSSLICQSLFYLPGMQERFFFHPLKGHSPEASDLISKESLRKRTWTLPILIKDLLPNFKKKALFS